MFRAKAAKMLYRGFYFLDKLEKIEEKECLIKELIVISFLFILANTKPLNFALADQLVNFDSFDPM